MITDSTILNKLESFSVMVDKWSDLPEDCIIPRELGCIDFTMNLSKSPMWHVLHCVGSLRRGGF